MTRILALAPRVAAIGMLAPADGPITIAIMNRFLDRTFRILTTILVATTLSLAPVASAQAQALAASDIDRDPPVIKIDQLLETVAGDVQVFTARVTDDGTLDTVSLHYRRAGGDAFSRVSMAILSGTAGVYSASVDTDIDDLRAFEYYVQAIDDGGNRTVYGFAFDPLTRALLPAIPFVEPVVETRQADEQEADEAPVAESAAMQPVQTTERADGGSNRRWWAIALGVVAVGALATLASDSGGSDDDGRVPLRIDLEEPR